MLNDTTIEKRELSAVEAHRLVNSIRNLIDWEQDLADDDANPVTRATARRLLGMMADSIQPYES